ncbi:MAG: hypothetical protein LBQ97_05005 [Fusobacteriaceae bacterium]|jgi:creatinine amidohydrolase/Fe(II)-dependent formamide hydrolase-like protein|nr:hypothetical protein [Fusobacteriaceae bacterium]
MPVQTLLLEEMSWLQIREGVTAVSPIGVLGDAGLATAELGARLFKALQDKMEEEIRRRLSCDC